MSVHPSLMNALDVLTMNYMLVFHFPEGEDGPPTIENTNHIP